MGIKSWTPFPYLDTEWRFDTPRYERAGRKIRPLMDIVKTDAQLVLTAELPGIAPEDVEVSLDGDILTIKGDKTDEWERSDADRYLHERVYGSFQRRVSVPDGVSAGDIDASFENGVLTLRVNLPERQAVEPKRIPVATKTP